ncbi:MAG TPA: hypothetical protein VN833_17440, partial [Candidatus Acidoferrales bacterium]|nr:hypothetical protein [Candidatus Acidoferrales bacterium]
MRYSLKWLYRIRSQWLLWQATYGARIGQTRRLAFASLPATRIHPKQREITLRVVHYRPSQAGP